MDCGLTIPVIVNLASADAREDAINGFSSLVKDRRYQDCGAEKELAVCGRKRGVVRKSQARARMTVLPVLWAR